MLKTKVGYSTLKDSYAKGKEAAKNANVGMRPKLGMMYCSCNDDVEEVVSVLQAEAECVNQVKPGSDAALLVSPGDHYHCHARFLPAWRYVALAYLKVAGGFLYVLVFGERLVPFPFAFSFFLQRFSFTSSRLSLIIKTGYLCHSGILHRQGKDDDM